MTAEWYLLASDNRSDGPYSADVVLALLRHGNLPPTALVRRLDGPWLAVSQAATMLSGAPVPPPLPGLSPAGPPTAVPPPLPVMSTVPGTQYQVLGAPDRSWATPPLIAAAPQATAPAMPPAGYTTASATSVSSTSRAGSAARPVVSPLVTLVSIVLGGVAAVALYAKYGHYFRPTPPPAETAPAPQENRRDLISPPR